MLISLGQSQAISLDIRVIQKWHVETKYISQLIIIFKNYLTTNTSNRSHTITPF